MEDTLKILESVDQFYSNAFTNLLTITVAALAFVGILVPVLVTLYQRRLYKVDQKGISDALRAELAQITDKALEKVKAGYIENEAKFEDSIRALETKFEKKLNAAHGKSMHLQGNLSLENKRYGTALESLVSCAGFYIRGEDEANLTRVLRILRDDCIPLLNKQNIGDVAEQELDIESMLKSLEKINTNGRYDDDIRNIRQRFKAALKRNPPKVDNAA